MKSLLLILLLALDFQSVDKLFFDGDYATCRENLLAMLPQADNSKDKIAVWDRLCQACLKLGEQQQDKAAKQRYFAEGLEYANQMIGADPKNPYGYLWHSAHIGRDCLTRGLSAQIKSVSVVQNDLTTIVEKLGRTDFSAAWQGLSEFFANHPLKSNENAVGLARMCVSTIPKDAIGLDRYMLLARLLRQRGKSAEKRMSMFQADVKAFARSYDSIIDKYAHFPGKDGATLMAPWSDKPLGTLSDKEEADAIIAYAEKLYKNTPAKSYDDKEQYKLLQQMKQK